MRVALIHNPEAGSGDHSGDTLVEQLRAAGHDAVYASTEAESLTAALNDEPDVVVAAGGDGTVAAVARLLAASGRDIPLAVLPMGTANNIARSLGATEDPVALATGLSTARRRRLDVGIVHAPWGDSRFVESAGVGLFAGTLRDAMRDEKAGTSPASNERNRGRRLATVMAGMHARHRHVVADGEDLSGSYLIAMTLNIACVGPSLELAPNADPGDGQLDLVLVREADREALGAYIASIARGDERRPAIPSRRVTRVQLGWTVEEGHVDDRLWPDPDSGDVPDAMVDIRLADRSLEVLVTA